MTSLALSQTCVSTAAENWIWPTFRDRVSFVWVCRGGLVITHE
jgi:hypothetical protein